LQTPIILGEARKFIPVIFVEWVIVAGIGRYRDLQLIRCPEYENWKRAFLSGDYLPYDSKRGFRRIPDDGSIDNKTDVLWVHQSVKLRSTTCQDNSSEQCYMF